MKDKLLCKYEREYWERHQDPHSPTCTEVHSQQKTIVAHLEQGELRLHFSREEWLPEDIEERTTLIEPDTAHEENPRFWVEIYQ